jgi:opacity protein-like surface antigen
MTATFRTPGLPKNEDVGAEGAKGGFLWGGGVDQMVGKRTYVSLGLRTAYYGGYDDQRGVRRTQVRLGLGLRF